MDISLNSALEMYNVTCDMLKNEETLKQIKVRYCNLMKAHHPDLYSNPDEKKIHGEYAMCINGNYDILCKIINDNLKQVKADRITNIYSVPIITDFSIINDIVNNESTRVVKNIQGNNVNISRDNLDKFRILVKFEYTYYINGEKHEINNTLDYKKYRIEDDLKVDKEYMESVDIGFDIYGKQRLLKNIKGYTKFKVELGLIDLYLSIAVI